MCLLPLKEFFKGCLQNVQATVDVEKLSFLKTFFCDMVYTMLN